MLTLESFSEDNRTKVIGNSVEDSIAEVFKDYLVMPEYHSWYPRLASSPEMAYRQESHWYSPDCRIAVLDPDTMEISVFTSVLDKSGSLVEVLRHDRSDLIDPQ